MSKPLHAGKACANGLLAACFATHSTIEGSRRLRARTGFGVAEVCEVVVHANASQLRMCAIPEPATRLETKFSLRHLAAMALSDVDTANADSFTDEGAHAADLVELRQRVTVTPDGAERAPTAVDVVLRDGTRHSIAHDVATPATDLEEQGRAVRAKFMALATPVLGPSRAAELAGLVDTIVELADVGPLMRSSQLASGE